MIILMNEHVTTSTVGQRIRELRAQKGWSQYDLAVEARLAPTTIHKIEVGKTSSPRIDALQSIAAAFGLTVDELMGTETSDRTDAASDPIRDLVEEIVKTYKGRVTPEKIERGEKILRGVLSLGERELDHVENQVELLLLVRHQRSTPPPPDTAAGTGG